MKNLVIIIAAVLFSINANAQSVLGTFSTSVEGGVAKQVNSLQPNIQFHSMNPFEDVTATLDEATVEAGNTTITIASNSDDNDFISFINVLSSTDEHLLKVGHNVGGVKAHTASNINAWFGEDANFLGKDIAKIEITYNNVTFNASENWTDFNYEMTVTIYGNDGSVASK